MTGHERFRERLAGFHAGCSRGRAEDQVALAGEAIGKAQAQRQLRSDDGEIDLFPLDDVNEIIRAGHVRTNETGNRLDTGISRRTEDFSDVALGSKPASQGMLARTGTDNQNSHRVNNLEAKIGLHRAGPRWGVFR